MAGRDSASVCGGLAAAVVVVDSGVGNRKASEWQKRRWQQTALFFALLCFLVNFVASDSDPGETAVLKAFRAALLDPNAKLGNWVGSDPCGGAWEGVYCGLQDPNNGNVSLVTELRLFQLGLGGTLVPDLGNLSHLMILDVMWNNLSGNIPPTLGNLTNLNLLLLNGNNFTGPLPSELGQLTNLNRLQIDQNNFSGNVPSSFGNLTSVQHLHMNNNSLTGSIPAQLGSLPKLLHLLLDYNQLSGELPAALANSLSLQIIQLDNNLFNSTVSIPPDWGRISTLIKLSLKNCNLSGNLPNFSSWNDLKFLDLSYNSFTGELPNSSYPVNLTVIDLSHNALVGPFPGGLGSLQNLQALVLEDNNITGYLPLDLGTGQNYQTSPQTVLDLQNNSLSINQSFVNRISHTNTKLWMYGNAQVCGGSSASKNPICVPQEYSSLIEDDITNVTAADSSNCSCTPPDVPGPFLGSNSACNCVQPIVVGFQLKSPSFLFFDEFSEVFLSWLTAGLDLSLSQVSIQDAQWVGPRLQMTLLLLPEVGVFNVTEFDSLYAIFSQWKIVDNPVLGPYELLSFYPRTPPGNTSPATKGLSAGAIAAIVLSVALVTAILVWLLMFQFFRRHGKPIITSSRITLKGNATENAALKVAGVKAFTFEELADITDQFDAKHVVGQGGYGKVYRGKLKDGQLVAIKRAEVGSLQGAHEFYTEIELLSRVHHKNLVKLVGYCLLVDESEQMLVYEFMPGGTLRDHLKASAKEPLDFTTRLGIALGSAKGILYLHTEANPPIFHRDIKASNILLDSDKTAKVADFGLSKLAPVPDLQGSIPDHISTVVKGTPGYMDPEYFLTHKLTDKSDVYSFGVVLLELFSGQQPIVHGKNIVREVIAASNAGKILSFVDPRMGSYNGDALRALFQLGMACCRDHTDDRPSMVEVVRELENIWRSSPYSMPLTSSVNFIYSPSSSDSVHYTGQDASSITALDIEKSNVTELLSHTVALVRPR
ncbi:hypothetical protein BDL97_13G029000 [Sphagnum fallax]|nr:hypothetical protein BDL97_13G029000 [Sphagnum fallax]